MQVGQPVLVISDPADIWVLANIKESYIREVVVGNPVNIDVDAYPDRRFQGKVETVGAAAISETTSSSIRASVSARTVVEFSLP